ncbi:hypothetical protein JOM56_010945 [Amanita muscaria]
MAPKRVTLRMRRPSNLPAPEPQASSSETQVTTTQREIQGSPENSSRDNLSDDEVADANVAALSVALEGSVPSTSDTQTAIAPPPHVSPLATSMRIPGSSTTATQTSLFQQMFRLQPTTSGSRKDKIRFAIYQYKNHIFGKTDNVLFFFNERQVTGVNTHTTQQLGTSGAKLTDRFHRRLECGPAWTDGQRGIRFQVLGDFGDSRDIYVCFKLLPRNIQTFIRLESARYSSSAHPFCSTITSDQLGEALTSEDTRAKLQRRFTPPLSRTTYILFVALLTLFSLSSSIQVRVTLAFAFYMFISRGFIIFDVYFQSYSHSFFSLLLPCTAFLLDFPILDAVILPTSTTYHVLQQYAQMIITKDLEWVMGLDVT